MQITIEIRENLSTAKVSSAKGLNYFFSS